MLDLFSGIGGFSYAGEKLVGGYETVAFCEYDKHAQKVLRKHWPDTEIIDDVRELANDADRFRGLVDIVVGGYPCQPFSLAGVRRGDKDDRHLWPEMLRIIQAVRPTWVIGENVAGHISMGLDTVLSDLEAEGYQARCFVIPAVAADARHRRDRCWIIAYADREGEPASAVDEQRLERAIMGNAQHDGSSAVGDIGRIQRELDRQTQEIEQSAGSSSGASAMGDAERKQWGAAETRRLDVDRLVLDRSQGREETNAVERSGADVPDADSEGLQRQSKSKGSRQKGRQQAGNESLPWGKSRFWQSEPAVGRVANGVSGRVHRLRQLGNSIVPQVAARILWAIKEAHND
jgi:DNA (cytosine-5)-methyltransferase 1